MDKSTAVAASDLFYNLTHANASIDPLWTYRKCGRVTLAQIYLKKEGNFKFPQHFLRLLTQLRVLHHSKMI